MNPGFESGAAGWQNTGTAGAAAVVKGRAYRGKNAVVHQAASAWTATTTQTLTGLARGTYTFTAWYRNTGLTTAAIQASGCGDTAQSLDLPTAATWTRATLAVSVLSDSDSCTVGITSSSETGSLTVDEFAFTRNVPGRGGDMPVGGDITYRRLNAAVGVQYADAYGRVQDVLDILKRKDFNLARIRVYNQPGTPVVYNGVPYNGVQPGYQNLDDAVENAKAAKKAGMKIFFSLHYSDWWTNPGIQTRPAAWAGYDQAQLEQAVYDFTVHSLTRLRKEAGVRPEFMSLGNEINNLLLETDRFNDPAAYYALLNKAAAAVRATSPKTKIVMHLTTPDKWLYNDWITKAKTYNLDYDLMGISAYPFWTNQTIATLSNFASWTSALAGKNVLICEVGYPWTPDAQGASEQTYTEQHNLDPDGPENYGATPEGQLTYMREYFRAMDNTGVVEGVSYWDPISVDQGDGPDPNGWIVGGDVGVEDTAFFDYGFPHKALPSLDAFKTW
ncbi:glycosyl hydrolase 53 family protein [Nonomuraea angiospora]|uniref:Arabinogalactan endo-beta-1,4-galactanase n=1 Tax=Nonomuraea angiospora TaxID=46172 RepID=A0ABR9M6I5_9ACTN|nr:glycosyl hydrolase 53 family protein [Nonomuraea angiospora]MBE1588225.1 arabinogalactan endo-1,4-beta-galactosidase [Nonomuraea angiospora]